MGSSSILELFIVLSKYYLIQELSLDDIVCNFKILKDKAEYQDLLKEYVYDDQGCPKLIEEISNLIKSKKVFLLNKSIVFSQVNETILSQMNEKIKLLTLRMVEDFILINTKKYNNQNTYVK